MCVQVLHPYSLTLPVVQVLPVWSARIWDLSWAKLYSTRVRKLWFTSEGMVNATLTVSCSHMIITFNVLSELPRSQWRTRKELLWLLSLFVIFALVISLLVESLQGKSRQRNDVPSTFAPCWTFMHSIASFPQAEADYCWAREEKERKMEQGARKREVEKKEKEGGKEDATCKLPQGNSMQNRNLELASAPKWVFTHPCPFYFSV